MLKVTVSKLPQVGNKDNARLQVWKQAQVPLQIKHLWPHNIFKKYLETCKGYLRTTFNMTLYHLQEKVARLKADTSATSIQDSIKKEFQYSTFKISFTALLQGIITNTSRNQYWVGTIIQTGIFCSVYFISFLHPQ